MKKLTKHLQSHKKKQIQTLHYKIINRIITCRKFLKHIKIVGSDNCVFCSQQDSLVQFISACPQVRSFWPTVCRWFDRVEHLNLENISVKHFLLGVPQQIPKARKINASLISVKFYIYRKMLFHECQLDLLHWLREFKLGLLVEREICAREGRSLCFSC